MNTADNWIYRTPFCKVLKYVEKKDKDGFERIGLKKLNSFAKNLFKGRVYFNEIQFFNYSGKDKEVIVDIPTTCMVMIPKRIRDRFEVSSDGEEWFKIFDFPFYTKFVFLKPNSKLKITFSKTNSSRHFNDLIFFYAE